MQKHNAVVKTKLVPLIEVKTTIGKGTKEDLCREIVEYFTLEGQLIAHIDPCDSSTMPSGWNGFVQD